MKEANAMTDQTPEARLAAALREAEFDPDAWPTDHTLQAESILAADPTLATDLALAEKVRRLGDSYVIRRIPYETDLAYRVDLWTEAEHLHGYSDTLTAAIEEALRDDPREQGAAHIKAAKEASGYSHPALGEHEGRVG